MRAAAQVAVLALAVAGCSKAKETSTTRAPPASPSPAADADAVADAGEADKTMEPVSLRWKLTTSSDKSALVVDYEVENTGSESIYLLDQLVIPVKEGLTVAPDRAVVRPGPDASTVDIVVGHVRPRPGQAIAFEAVPVAREVKAGDKVTGTKHIPLPLASWHPYMTMLPLEGEPSRAVLDVTWLPAEPPDGQPAWEDHPSPGGKTIRTPSGVFMRLALQTTRGAVHPIP